MLRSTVCRAATFLEPWFGEWGLKLGVDDPSRPFEQRNLHRKVWEWVSIVQAIHERGFLRPGASALGFAVGNEKLPALFASCGVKVLATDIGDTRIAASWRRSGEYAGSRDKLHHERLVSREVFDRLVDFRHLDMRDLSSVSAERYDFVWSACSLEHLGSLKAGMDFVVSSTQLLKPGGIGVHTTEYNLSSLDDTVSTGETVLYRRGDLERLDGRLRLIGAGLEPLDLDPGTHEYDLKYDVPPFSEGLRKHLKLRLMGHVCTSVMLIVQN
jgi:2-polyprenyl-3-methyl-5-hydroxy-6-metoxy-1,4-benzoquinol methylase